MNEKAHSSPDERALLDFVATRDIPCPMCGYNLRSLTRARCPECDQELQLTVGVTRLRLGWFIASIAPGIFSGIFATILTGVILIVVSSGGPAPTILPVALTAFGWLSGLAALAIIIGRYRFLRLRRSTQMSVAVVLWAIHLTAFVMTAVPAL